MSSQSQLTKVKIIRHPGSYTLIGRPIIILSLEDAAKALRISGFMDDWVCEKIKEHLLNGHEFANRDETTGTPKSIYSIATEQDVLDYVDSIEYEKTTGHRQSSKAQVTAYRLHHKETPELVAAYDDLPRQAKIILDLLLQAKRDKFTEAAIEMLMVEHVEDLKTRQAPIRIFMFYRRRFIGEGHLEEIND